MSDTARLVFLALIVAASDWLSQLDDVLAGRARWCVIHGDNANVLPVLPDKSVAHVITDPPYDSETHSGALCGAPESGFGVSFDHLASAAETAKMLLRLASRWTVAFCALEQLGDYRKGAERQWVRAGVWDKINPSPQLTGDRPGQAVEGIAIMHASGKKRWNGGGEAAIWRCAPDRGADRPEHPTPKPVSLMLELVELFTDPDELVLDPFAGSGTTGVACLRLGRRVICVEKDAKYAAVARERLAAESQGLSLRDARAGQTSLFGDKS
jgi:site-specific DNA-methyltransferase (adenine-specific)